MYTCTCTCTCCVLVEGKAVRQYWVPSDTEVEITTAHQSTGKHHTNVRSIAKHTGWPHTCVYRREWKVADQPLRKGCTERWLISHWERGVQEGMKGGWSAIEKGVVQITTAQSTDKYHTWVAKHIHVSWPHTCIYIHIHVYTSVYVGKGALGKGITA